MRRIDAKRVELRQSLRDTGKHPLFKQVEIETFNRCNGECSFCPVNRHEDSRIPSKMDAALFESIIDQLKALDYKGRISLYSNNEPFLDDRIPLFSEYVRNALPDAEVTLSSNGSLLTVEKYLSIMPYLDSLVIDNYCRDFVFKPAVREIMAVSESDADLKARTRITMRYTDEIMTSRGGLSPNKKAIRKPVPFGCMSPTQQFIVRPTGEVSLCCNDALGKVTMGDLSKNSVAEVWYGDAYGKIREEVMNSRSVFEICRFCDTMNG